MRRSERTIQTFLLDSNIFAAAVRNPKKQTHTLKLLLKIIEDPNMELIGDNLLVEEMLRYAELLESQTAASLILGLLSKTRIVNVSKNYRKICRSYLQTPDKADATSNHYLDR